MVHRGRSEEGGLSEAIGNWEDVSECVAKTGNRVRDLLIIPCARNLGAAPAISSDFRANRRAALSRTPASWRHDHSLIPRTKMWAGCAHFRGGERLEQFTTSLELVRRLIESSTSPA